MIVKIMHCPILSCDPLLHYATLLLQPMQLLLKGGYDYDNDGSKYTCFHPQCRGQKQNLPAQLLLLPSSNDNNVITEFYNDSYEFHHKWKR